MNKKGNSGTKAPLGVLLLGATAALAIALIAAILISSTRMKMIEQQDEHVYYDMLYTISSDLINADRDLYQAMLAATEKLAYGEHVDATMIQGYVTE